MRIQLLMLLFTLSICAAVSAQTVKIKKVLDSNLFETFDGRIIKLAGVDAPEVKRSAPYLRDVAESAYLYARSAFLNRHFTIVPLLPKDTTKNYELVFMQKDYPLGPVDYNKEYLLEGFGRFTGSVPDAFYSEYKNAEKKAVEKKKGIWNFISSDSALVLERQFSPEEAGKIREQDSLLFIRDAFKRRSSPEGKIASELVMAPISGFAGAYMLGFASVGLGAAFGNAEGFGLFPYAVLGAGVGYTAGTALFIYLMERHDNPNVSFWGTLGYSFIGAGAGIGIASLLSPPSQYIAFFAGPVISSIIYAYYVVPEPQFGDFYPTAESNSFKQRSYSHKDLYNSTLLYNVNLLNIAF